LLLPSLFEQQLRTGEVNVKFAIALALAAALPAHMVFAQDLPQTELKVVGSLGMLSIYNNYEKPFFTEALPEASGGKVTAEIQPFNEFGLTGAEIMRLTENGTLQFASTPMGYLIGENAINAGNDLPGIAPTADDALAITEAWKPVVAESYAANGVKLLAIYPYSAQVAYCNTPITGLEDLAGKKIRASGAAVADFIEGLGGTAVSMAFGEVVQGLQKGVVDCAITGAMSGFDSKWYEVSTHLLELPIAWSPVAHVVNEDVWDGLDASVQTFLTDEIATLEADVWAAAKEETTQGIACNTGVGDCPRDGETGKLTLVSTTDADIALRDKILEKNVLPAFLEQCGEACAAEWQARVAPLVGLN
jgi:TRAP-type C4-dicarboxylate transport system substrate-binding protein